MLLAIDVGNTQIVLGVFDGSALRQHYRIESRAQRTVDEYHVLLRQLVGMSSKPQLALGASIMASVVPALGDTISEAVHNAFGLETLVVGPGMKTGMPILYDNPKEVGADRIVNAVAAFEHVKGGAIVVDFGTATTFDCVSPKGEYMGGVIAPGIGISAEALAARTAKLPRTDIVRPPRVLGKTTTHSMQSGVVFGHVGMVDGLVERLKAELGFNVTVIATGGLAGLIEPDSRTIDQVEEYLTLDGLRVLYERNLG
ncbi:MAG: type III pantothenate kinase [Myxococcales bacterium]|nr:type III pantothenate kinase [Myxococcales bacterium]